MYKKNQKLCLINLLREMLNYETLSRIPSPNYHIEHASSYDRRSVTPSDPDGWFANDDTGHFLRKEVIQGRDEYVMADFTGPGCLCRLWTADHRLMPIPERREPEEAIVRIYIDDQEDPIVQGQFHDVFNGSGFFPEPYCHTSHSSAVSYFPIPFAGKLKMTLDSTPQYYNITARIYDKGTGIESFKAEDLITYKDEIFKYGKKLLDPKIEKNGNVDRKVQISAGEEREIARLEGPGAITELGMAVNEYTANALRGSVIRIQFDDNETVYCPLGEFFGCGTGLHPFSTLTRDVDERGLMRCRWVMPYRSSARFSILNLDGKEHEYKVMLNHSDYTWNEQSMYFHSGWRYSNPIHTRPFSDWNYVTVDGGGRYLGDTLTVHNPVKIWWGEGDEKIWVDDDKFPSIFGTGTEDYYGYSWGGLSRGFYDHPMHAQVRVDCYDKLWKEDIPVERNTKGLSTELRNLMLESVVFKERLKFDMEVWHWEECDMAYAVACFWYALPGSSANFAKETDLIIRSMRDLEEFQEIE